MKKLLMIVLIVALIFNIPTSTEAKTTTKYATQTIALKQKANVKSKTVYKVKRNTKLTQLKAGKTWAQVKYKNKKLYVQKAFLHAAKSDSKWSGRQFRRMGVGILKGYKWTWYSQRVLPGRGLKIPGRHLDNQGFVCDKNDYIVLASSTRNRGKIIATPFGKYGKVYDAGCGGSSWMDVYTGW